MCSSAGRLERASASGKEVRQISAGTAVMGKDVATLVFKSRFLGFCASKKVENHCSGFAVCSQAPRALNKPAELYQYFMAKVMVRRFCTFPNDYVGSGSFRLKMAWPGLPGLCLQSSAELSGGSSALGARSQHLSCSSLRQGDTSRMSESC